MFFLKRVNDFLWERGTKRITPSSIQTMNKSEKSCCCQNASAECQPNADSMPVKGITFKIEALDCVEEVTILKSEIGSFDTYTLSSP